MLYKINNKDIVLKVDSFGAEMHSLKRDSIEYIWQCGDAWRRYAPILFPFISSPTNRRYMVNGIEYIMKANHGFARDMEFKLVKENADMLVFELHSNNDTKLQYPFDFVLSVSYKLSENSVEIQNLVKNMSNTPMYFYIGNHPAFNCPIDNGMFNDYRIEYEKTEDLKHQNGEKIKDVVNGKTVFLTRSLFDNDVIITNCPNSKSITLCSDKSSHSVTVEFPNIDTIAVWSPTADEQATFVCMEPWASLPVDFDNDEAELSNKKHSIMLDVGGNYIFSYRITVK